ncbi:MAG TPA: DNA repair protein RecO C-terminal domain-containing protein [Planctomycetota bacterium]|nr:DNA repair protein RecO C-terminal domain-containing protein [Planctomycetota bacterium]
MKIRDQAVLIANYPASQSSCVLHLLTRDHGVVHLFARGFRRISGKIGFQGSGDCLTLGEVVYRPASTEPTAEGLGQLLAQEWTEELRPENGHTLAALARRTLAAEAIDSLLGAGQVETEVFELLVDYLREINSPRPARRLAHVLLRLLTLSGHRPELQRSVLGGQKMPDGPYHAAYSFELGGIITREERSDAKLLGPFWDLPSGIARVADRFARQNLEAGASLEFPADADQTLLDFAIVLAEAAAERTFKSARVLRQRRSPFPLRTWHMASRA